MSVVMMFGIGINIDVGKALSSVALNDMNTGFLTCDRCTGRCGEFNNVDIAELRVCAEDLCALGRHRYNNHIEEIDQRKHATAKCPLSEPVVSRGFLSTHIRK